MFGTVQNALPISTILIFSTFLCEMCHFLSFMELNKDPTGNDISRI